MRSELMLHKNTFAPCQRAKERTGRQPVRNVEYAVPGLPVPL